MIRFDPACPRRVVPALALLLAASLAAPAVALAAGNEPMRHHFTFGVGPAWLVSEDFEDTGLENSTQGQFTYRYSISRSVDLCFDFRSVMSSDEMTLPDSAGATIAQFRTEHDVLYVGPGVRWSPSMTGALRPYAQGSIFFTTETLRFEVDDVGIDGNEGCAGFGLMAGVDIRLSRLISVPVEGNYLLAWPGPIEELEAAEGLNVSSLGLSVGLTLNFTPLP